MGHIEDMAEEVVAAGSRTAGTGGLHGETAEGQAFEEIRHSLRITGGDTGRIRQEVVQIVLQHVPCRRDNGLGGHQVGYHPLRSGGHLRGQVGITGGRHLFRGGGNHVDIGDDGNRSRAGKGLFGILVGNRSAERRKTVHGGGGRQGQVLLPMVMRTEFAQVVDDTGTDGNQDEVLVGRLTESLRGIGLDVVFIVLDGLRRGKIPFHNLVHHLHVLPLGVEFLLVDDVFLYRVAGCGKEGLNLLAQGRPGVHVCYDDALAAGEQFCKNLGSQGRNALSHFKHLRVGSELQRVRNSLFSIHINIVNYIQNSIYKDNNLCPIRQDKSFKNLNGGH